MRIRLHPKGTRYHSALPLGCSGLTYVLLSQTRQQVAVDLRNELSHLFGVLQTLMGKRLVLLEMEPVDASAWRRTVKELLAERIDLLEQLKLGSFRDEPRPVSTASEPRPVSPRTLEPCPPSDP